MSKNTDNEMATIMELAEVAKNRCLDIESNIPDFAIGAFMYKAFCDLMAANKAADEYFVLCAEEEELGNNTQFCRLCKVNYWRDYAA